MVDEWKAPHKQPVDNIPDFWCRIDEIVKSRKCPLPVIPAKAGIQCSHALTNSWTPFFNGVTTFYEIVNLLITKKAGSNE